MTEDDKLKILSYRRKHKRCRYCKYYFYPYVPHELKLTSTFPPECAVKDKKIYPFEILCDKIDNYRQRKDLESLWEEHENSQEDDIV